jgi:hypothetical protein
MPIGLGGLGGVDVDQIGAIIEYLDKAGERSINGYPIFMSCRVVHKDDWAQVAEKAMAIDAAIKEAMK